MTKKIYVVETIKGGDFDGFYSVTYMDKDGHLSYRNYKNAPKTVSDFIASALYVSVWWVGICKITTYRAGY